MDDYRLFVNEDRTVMVRIWRPAFVPFTPCVADVLEVATRDAPGDVWGPPVLVKEEK
jgi:hypothetical protein